MKGQVFALYLIIKMRSYQRTQYQNKENMREATLNKQKKAIRLKHSQRPPLGEQKDNETTAFFNPPSLDIEIERQGQKLIQLTSQCAQYFERFTVEKDAHLQIIDRAFSEVGEKVQQAFGKIILQAQRKLSEIRSFLGKEYQRLRQQKQTQEDQLNKLLQEINLVHLTKLDSGKSLHLPQVLSQYAATLDKFFNVMTDIQSNSYEDSVQECMSFINNLVRQELKTIESRFPPCIKETIGEFASNDEFFTFEQGGIRQDQDTVGLLDPIEKASKQNINELNALNEIKNIKSSQSVREGRINQYQTIMTFNNPFKAVKLAPSSNDHYN